MTRRPESESLPISLVAHTIFCPRRAWLEAMGERPPRTGQMAAGTAAHRRVDKPTVKDEAMTLRGVDVRHSELGYHGRIDRAERIGETALRLIEHKATPVKRRAEVSDANRVQLALQAMALEDQGHEVVEAGVYFTQHNTTVYIDLDGQREAAKSWVKATRDVVSSATAPEPLVDDPRCQRCSHRCCGGSAPSSGARAGEESWAGHLARFRRMAARGCCSIRRRSRADSILRVKLSRQRLEIRRLSYGASVVDHRWLPRFEN